MTELLSDDRYLDVTGARLRFRDEGHGPPVLFVHGWTLDLGMWDGQCAALRDSYRVVRLDRRGFGLSSGEPSGAADVEDLARLCGALALERVAVVGMSQGARTAVGFSASSAAFVTSLVLQGPPNMAGNATSSPDDVPVAEYRALMRAEGIAAFRRAWAMHPLMQLTTHDDRVRARVRSMLERYRGLDLLADESYARLTLSAGDLGSIGAPTLLITGDGEPASRTRAADILARRLPRAERVVIPNAGHFANLDNPESYNRILRSFLDRHLPDQV